jgi:hypothetical protein
MLLDMRQALRCHARSKRSGLKCRAPAGAPKGNKNALEHGLYTAEAVETRRMVAALTKQARARLVELA